MSVPQFEPSLTGLNWVKPHIPAAAATDQALELLLRSPRLPEAMRRLQAVTRAEAKKRRYFYDVITEQQKAEFINGEIIVHSPVKYATQSGQSTSVRLCWMLTSNGAPWGLSDMKRLLSCPHTQRLRA